MTVASSRALPVDLGHHLDFPAEVALTVQRFDLVNWSVNSITFTLLN